MSDISMPPAPPAATTPKKRLIDSAAVKYIFLLMGFTAPLPMLIVLINFWLEHASPEGEKGNSPFDVFQQMLNGSGTPPMWLIPCAFVPSVVLLMVLLRNNGPRALSLIALVLFASVETFLFTFLLQN